MVATATCLARMYSKPERVIVSPRALRKSSGLLPDSRTASQVRSAEGLDTTKASDWVLTPLPNSLPCAVEIKLDQLGAAGAKVTRIQPQDEAGKDLDAARFEQTGDRLRFQTAAAAFAYRISLGK